MILLDLLLHFHSILIYHRTETPFLQIVALITIILGLLGFILKALLEPGYKMDPN